MKTVIEKVMVVKNKVIPKPAGSPAVVTAPAISNITPPPVAQNSTH